MKTNPQNLKQASAFALRRGVFPLAVLIFLFGPIMATGPAGFPVKGFIIEQELLLPGTPEQVFDAITGDISGWWDHSFSEKPFRFFIEPKPGGGFWEYFDDQGNGVRHAVVIFSQRGKMLRFEGPLGLSGRAVQMVHTYSFEVVEPGQTRLKLSVHAQGEIDENLARVVEQVWHHFLVERFKPYYLSQLELIQE